MAFLARITRVRAQWWALPALIFLMSRVIYAAFIAVLAPLQTTDSTRVWRESANPRAVDFWTILSNWDSASYYNIARNGYPEGLPRDPDGAVAINDWAFYPAWAYLLRGLEWLTGLPYPLLGGLTALACGLGAVLLLHRFVETQATRWLALCLTVWLSFFPASVVLQTGYSESFFLLLLAGLLWALHRRAYPWALALITLMALTRPIVLPVALLLLLLGAVRLYRARKGSDEFPLKEQLWLGGLALYAAASFAVWPLIVGLATGGPNAYLLTQDAWRAMGTASIGPYFLTGLREEPLLVLRYAGIAVGLGLTMALGRGRDRWPLLILLWAGAYFAYIYATIQAGIYSDGQKVLFGAGIEPHPSIWRYMLLLALPFIPFHLLAQEKSPSWRRALVLGLMGAIGLGLGFAFTKYHLLDRLGHGLYWP